MLSGFYLRKAVLFSASRCKLSSTTASSFVPQGRSLSESLTPPATNRGSTLATGITGPRRHARLFSCSLRRYCPSRARSLRTPMPDVWFLPVVTGDLLSPLDQRAPILREEIIPIAHGSPANARGERVRSRIHGMQGARGKRCRGGRTSMNRRSATGHVHRAER